MKFECPSCSQHLEAESSYAGQSINCPACGQAFVVPHAVLALASSKGVSPPPATPRPTPIGSRRTSRLAISSLGLSLAGLLLGPLGCVPGVICGHLARRALRRNPALGGAGFAKAGLLIGYSVTVLLTAGVLALFTMGVSILHREVQSPQLSMQARGTRTDHGPIANASHQTGGQALDQGALNGGMSNSVTTVDGRDYSTIDLQNAKIPARPAQSRVLGQDFSVRRAWIQGNDLVLKGDQTSDFPEIRVHVRAKGPNRFGPDIPSQVEIAARFGMETLLFDNGLLGRYCTVTFRTAQKATDLTADAGMRLVFHAPQNGGAKTSIELGFGRVRRGFVVGEFTTELPPELAAKVRHIKPVFGFRFPLRPRTSTPSARGP